MKMRSDHRPSISSGGFAIGFLVGLIVSVLALVALDQSCPDADSILWFCGEQPKVVLRTLALIEAVLTAALWPTAIVIVAWFFSEEIRTLLPSLVRVGPTGAEFDPGHQRRKADVSLETELRGSENTPLTDPMALQIERDNESELQKFPDEQRQKVLLRALTTTQLEKFFALAYADIFGSQIRALDILNGRTVSKAEAKKLFETLKREDPIFEDWDLDRYMNYLVSWRFIEDKGDHYEMTVTGRNFLRFVTSIGLSKERLH